MKHPIGLRAAALPVVATALVSGVLGVQLANGGGHFVPLRPADPCVVRRVASVSSGIEGLTERLVVLGLDRAACRLGTSREALVLDLARPGLRTATQIRALHAGLLDAIARLNAAGQLPPAADLVDEAVDDSGLNFLVKAAIKALPDSLINRALKTDDVLRRTVDNLDLRTLLSNLGRPDDLSGQVTAAVKKAVEDALIDDLRHLV